MSQQITNPRRHFVMAAIHWAFENDSLVHIAVLCAPKKFAVPMAYAKDGKVPVYRFNKETGQTSELSGMTIDAKTITLNIGMQAVNRYVEGENSLSFQSRFNSEVVSFEIPYDYIFGVYCPAIGSVQAMYPVDLNVVEEPAEEVTQDRRLSDGSPPAFKTKWVPEELKITLDGSYESIPERTRPTLTRIK